MSKCPAKWENCIIYWNSEWFTCECTFNESSSSANIHTQLLELPRLKTIEANTTAENTAHLSLTRRWANFIGYAPTSEYHFWICATFALGHWIRYWCWLTIWRLNGIISQRFCLNIVVFIWRIFKRLELHSNNWVIRVVEVVGERDWRRWSIDRRIEPWSW